MIRIVAVAAFLLAAWLGMTVPDYSFPWWVSMVVGGLALATLVAPLISALRKRAAVRKARAARAERAAATPEA